MWNLKFKVKNEDSIYTLISKKYKVLDYLYPVDYYKENGKIYILGIHLFEGEPLEVKRFVSELKKNKNVKKFEFDNKHLITLIEETELFYKLLYSAKLYHISPVLVEEGYETWNVASFDRNLLEKLIKEIGSWKSKFPEFILQKLDKISFSDIYFPRIVPKLPEKQKRAFNLALKKNYYSFPRKIDLQGLAKEEGVSTSTFQENLRKAEFKLLPFFAEGLNK